MAPSSCSPGEPGPVMFAHIEKTAGKTIRGLLRRHFGAGHCELYNHWNTMRPEDLGLIRRHHPRLGSLAGHACMPHSVTGQIPGARMFTFFRSPIDRAFSAYQYGHQRGRSMPDFEAWAADHANFMCRSLTGIPRAQATAERAIDVLETRVGFVGLLSQFDLSLVLLRRWIDLPGFQITYRSRNRAHSNRMKLDLLEDPGNLALLERLNGEDLKLYEHAQGVFEQQKRAYGPSLNSDLQAFLEQKSRRWQPLPPIGNLWGRLRRDLIFRPTWKKHLRARAAETAAG